MATTRPGEVSTVVGGQAADAELLGEHAVDSPACPFDQAGRLEGVGEERLRGWGGATSRLPGMLNE
jgi:hypothetical protein